MKPFNLGFQSEEEPLTITAASSPSKYTMSKIARDHENFKKVLAKHYAATDKLGRKRPARFEWKKIFTRKYAVHHFSHPHPHAPTIVIKRAHIGGAAVYHVRVKMPKIGADGKPTGRHIYNRKIVTAKPSATLNKMLTDARRAQFRNKVHREPKERE